MKMNKKMIHATVAFVGVLACLTLAYAVATTWTGNISWTMASKTFEVYLNATGRDALATPYSIPLGIVDVDTIKSMAFYIQNTGNAPITVIASDTGSGYNTTTASWNLGGNYTIPVETTRHLAQFNMTITGAGSCAVTFTGD